MNKYTSFFLFALFIASFSVLSSCSDDDTEDTDPREETLQMLAGEQSKSWSLVSIHVNGANATSILLDECSQDDLFILYRDGEGEVLGNELKCFDGEPEQIATGTWELHDDLETMYLNLSPFFEEDVEIMEVTSERLQLRKEEGEDTIMVTYRAAD